MKKLTLKANVAVCAAFKPTTFSQSFRQNSSETFGHCPVLTFGWLEWSGGAPPQLSRSLALSPPLPFHAARVAFRLLSRPR